MPFYYHCIASLTFFLVLILTELRNVRASPAGPGPSRAGGSSIAGLSDAVAAELIAQNIQCHPNYGTHMDEVAADCAAALQLFQEYAGEYGYQRYEFGDEGAARRFHMPSWNTPITQPFIQG